MSITEKTFGPEVSRRAFLAGAGGLTFAIALDGSGVRLISPALAATPGGNLGAWVRIAPDNSITILTAGAEMGQGSMTSVPLMLAEELDADWDKVALEWAPSEPKTYGYARKRRGRISHSMAIVGSRAVQMYFGPMRMAGAQVRKALIQAAAKSMGVAASELTTEPSVVVHKASGKRMTYGEIAASGKVASKLPAVSKGELKKPSSFRLIGKPVPRRDTPLKVNGTASYSMDVQLPGMVYASTVHSEVQGEKPESWNDDEIKRLPGVLGAVKLDMGVAVVADNFEHVIAARKALKVKWTKGARAEGFDSEHALEKLYPAMESDPKAKAKKVYAKGDANAAFKAAAKTYKAEYRADFGYHAQMEPLNAVARLNAAGDRVEIWEGTQAPGRSVQMVAQALGFKESQVTHHQRFMGGGFGRRSLGDYGVEAALIARELKKPVKMIWTREEDLKFAMFRPQNFQCLEAALDSSGKVIGWKHCIAGDGRNLLTGGMKTNRYYSIPNQYMELRGVSHGIRLKHWRSVAHVFNVYAIEAFVDEMARSEGMDPLAFRLEKMPLTKKARAVFEKVAEISKWSEKRPAGRAVGLSVTERSGSLGAAVVEISLDRESNQIRVHKVWMAIDGGLVVQPEAARRNVESGILYGMSSVLKERATVRGGAVQQSNFDTYHVLRMSEAPDELHVEFLDRTTRPTGLGEIGNPPIPAAIASAFFTLTGKRLYHMPFTPERVAEALKA